MNPSHVASHWNSPLLTMHPLHGTLKPQDYPRSSHPGFYTPSSFHGGLPSPFHNGLHARAPYFLLGNNVPLGMGSFAAYPHGAFPPVMANSRHPVTSTAVTSPTVTAATPNAAADSSKDSILSSSIEKLRWRARQHSANMGLYECR